jgi:hypothetical protein
VVLAAAIAATCVAPSSSARAALQGSGVGAKALASASLAQCVTAVEQTERSATFAGEMTAIPGAVRMGMRIEVLERLPAEALFHPVIAPGLGVWRAAAPGVKTYRYLKQVTNLSAPSSYRASVRFRWINAKGHVIKSQELRTPRCEEPAPPPSVPPPAAGTTTGA